MSREDIFRKLDEIYEDKKARNFLNHLVRSYFPNNKVEKVFVKPKGSFKCVLTRDKLVSVNQILSGVKEESFKNDFFEYMHNMFNPNVQADTPIKKLMDGRHLGVQGKNTDTFMSSQTYIIFYDWVLTKFMKGDKHIAWLLKDINKNQFIDRAEGLEDDEVKKIIKKKRKKEDGNRATYSLGDFSALQALKDKMENK